MAITVDMCNEDEVMTVKFSGSFTFDDWPEFAGKCLGIAFPKTLYLDLSELKQINVAGLGMILFMCEKLPKRYCQIRLKGCSQEIEKLLYCVDFERLIISSQPDERQFAAA